MRWVLLLVGCVSSHGRHDCMDAGMAWLAMGTAVSEAEAAGATVRPTEWTRADTLPDLRGPLSSRQPGIGGLELKFVGQQRMCIRSQSPSQCCCGPVGAEGSPMCSCDAGMHEATATCQE